MDLTFIILGVFVMGTLLLAWKNFQRKKERKAQKTIEQRQKENTKFWTIFFPAVIFAVVLQIWGFGWAFFAGIGATGIGVVANKQNKR